MLTIRYANNLVQEYKPWELAKKNESNFLKKLTFLINETLRISSILLQPIVPNLAMDVLDRLAVKNEERLYEDCSVDYFRKDSRVMVVKSDVIFKKYE